MQNQVLAPEVIAALKAENDHSFLELRGEKFAVEHAETPGIFLVDNTGKISINFLADAGSYRSEMAIFSLQGIDNFTPGSGDYIKEAARRALSNSPLGYIVIIDPNEGAKFTGELGENNQNEGNYSGIKTFDFTPGSQIAMMLVPQGTVQQVFDNPNVGNNQRPLFSIAAANPNNATQMGQLVPGTFGWEDIRVDQNTDADYNDIIFQIKGATGTTTEVGQLFAVGKDWRNLPLGQEIITFASIGLIAKLAQDTGIVDSVTNNPEIVGSLNNASNISKLQARLGGSNFADILSELKPDGNFVLNKNKLAQINGGQLADGEYQLTLRAENQGGNVDEFLVKFTLDNTKPGIPTEIGLKNDSDTVTNQNTPTITGKGETGALIEILDGQNKLGQTIVVNGFWEITTSQITDGLKNLTITATDIAGNKSDAGTKEFTIDSALPQINITNPQANAQLTTGARLQGTVNGTGSIIDKLTYRFGDGSEINVPVNAQGAFDVELNLTGLSSGQQNLIIKAIDLAGNSTETTQIVVITQSTPDTTAPLITASLNNDTGINTDGITFDSTITGTVTDSSEITTFQAKLNSGNFVDVLAKLQNGNFTLDTATLTQINGGQLPDGTYQLTLKAEDKFGNVSSEVKLDFTLDITAPQTPGFMLDTILDSAPIGDSRTTFTNVKLIGQTEANTTVKLQGIGTSITTDATGKFNFTNVELALGDNSFTVNAQDIAGNTSTFTTIIKRVEQDNGDVVLDWNATLLNAIYEDKTTPPVASRNMAITQTAVFDAINTITGTYKNYHFTGTAPTIVSAEAAAASAAHQVLINLYPGQKSYFDNALTASLAEITDGTAEDNGVTFGRTVADAILTFRSGDGSSSTITYTPGTNPGQWQPTSPGFASALLPQWGQVTPFALTSGDQFRPDGTPALNSAEYTTEFNQVKDLGSKNSTNRTTEQTQIAKFWADGSGTFTPPGHWNQIAQNVAATKGNSLVDNARLFALLDISLADAGIAAWDAKYNYNFWRPITAIQNADSDGNADTIADASWTPLLTTPPFPEYVSGHSTFSGAAETILTGLLGNNVSFTTNSLGTPGIYRTFSNFTNAANEAGISRIYGGIHFNSANVEGLATGRSVGNYVLENLLAPKDNIPPTVAISSTPSTATSFVELTFNEPVQDSSFTADKYSLVISGGVNDGQAVTISSVEKLSSTLVRLNLAAAFTTGNYKLTVASGLTDIAGNATTTAQNFDLNIAAAPLEISPNNGEEMVGLNRETVVRFGKKIDPTTVKDDSFYLIANGQRIAGNIKVSSTEEFATFFYANPLPASTEVRVVVDGSKIIGRDGVAIDGNLDGVAGGIATADFTTLPITRIPGTDVWGYVYDSYNKNPDGSNIPIKGVTIRLDALPNVFAVTDDKGYFILEDVPAPDFYVYIDGSTATGAPAATQYASLGKPFHSVPGQSTQLFMDGLPFDVYLPPMAASDVKPLSTTEDTQVGFGEVSQAFLQQLFPDVDPDVWTQVQVTFVAGSAQDDAGNVATQAMIIPVDPQRLPAPLPPGVDPQLVISIQAGGANGFNREADGGATNFDVPAPIQFPNLEGLKPGEKSLFWSFDHDAGKWIVIGTGTVSEDGLTIKSDPGVGVLAPGWHFVNPGTPTNGPTKPDKPDDCDPDVFTIENAIDLFEQVTKCTAGFFKIQGLIAKVFEIASEAKSLIGSADKLLKGLEDGSLNASDVQALFQSINSTKKILKSTFDGIKDQNPLGKALAISKCLENLLGFSASVCGKITEQDSGCNTIAVKTVCNGLDLAKSTLGKVNSLIEKAEEGLKESLFALACGTIDQIASLLGFAAQNEGARIGVNSINIQAESDTVSPETLEELKTLVPKLIGEMEGFLVNAEAGAEMGEILEDVGQQIGDLEPSVGQMAGELLDYPANAYYLIEYGNFASRGRTDANGQFDTILAPNTEFKLSIYDAQSGRIATYTGKTTASGFATEIPALAYVTTEGIAKVYQQQGIDLPEDLINELSDADLYGLPDSDNDGLVDEAENIIGTTANKKDTDNDGINDLAEIQQGLDPLGGQAFPTGIISSLPLFGEAKAITVTGSTTNTQNQTAYVATGSYGLAIVNASQFNNPIILGQLDLPGGDATDVAVDTNLQIAAVASNNGGLQLVDVSDPMLPVLKQTININASQVEVVDGIAYATVGTSLRAVDLLSGEQIQQVTLPGSGTVTGLARDGSYLYGFISGPDIFFTVDISNSAAVTLKGQLTVSIASTDVGVFAGNGVAYLAGSGMRTIDISNPANPTLISDSDLFFTARNIALNGSGLALIASEDQGIGVYDIIDPQNTNNVVFSIDTPGFTYGVALASGIAYVADGTGGLQVINYLPFDNKGVAPTVMITSPVVDLDPNQAGIQITEGGSISIQANVTDDVQVRNVELLVNGQVVSNDLSFPFDLNAIALSNDPNAPVVNVQTRVTDTGGNTSLSNILTFDLVPDTIAPSIDSFSANMRTATIRFSEALDTTKITAANFTLINSSNQTSVPENIQFRDGDRTIQLTYPVLAVGNYQLVIDAAQLSDRAGNALGVEDVIKTFDITPELIFTAPQSGFVGFSGTPVLITTFEIAPNTTLPTQIQDIEISFVMDDGDSAPGDFDFNDLTLYLDDINTGIILNGWPNDASDFRNTVSGTPLNGDAILAALQADGKLIATFSDADPDDNFWDLSGGFDATLKIK
ncbi:hypothetical protein SR1949_05570 [Sphaerospermopsis reniformis]|uniref:Uncharacterized protein n=1 Tax=Sphaerospermopsis reniformis TaxID=531300 RepID=A0A479ZTF8_9CYAN|nr:hypothetical protein SR1949_05570 [Sphaerospermopsis reniformis]